MKKKSLIITLIMILIICVLVNSASALSLTATMTPSSTTVPESTEFTVTIKVSNIDAGQNGINSLQGYLKYDTAVFETISATSIEKLNTWTPEYNAETGKIVLYTTIFVKDADEVLQITFKTKSGVNGKSGSIKLSNIIASNSESEISAADISTTITVGTAPAVGNTNTPKNPITINANTNVVNTPSVISPNVNTKNTNNTNTNVVPVGNTTPEEDIPYTGAGDVAMRAIFVVLVVAAISYFKYESMKDVK